MISLIESLGSIEEGKGIKVKLANSFLRAIPVARIGSLGSIEEGNGIEVLVSQFLIQRDAEMLGILYMIFREYRRGNGYKVLV